MNPTHTMQACTVLKLDLLFGAEQYFVHRQAIFNGDQPSTLSAMVTRRFHHQDAHDAPATGKVYNNLEFRITDAINEDPSGSRFLVSAIATAELQMEHGSIAPNGNQANSYAEGTEGICEGTELKLFIDLQTHTGVILSFTISDGYIIKLGLPDDVHFDPSPNPIRTIPYSLRRPFREDIICQHRTYTPPAPGTDDPAPEAAGD